MKRSGLVVIGAGVAGLVLLIAGVAIGRSQTARPATPPRKTLPPAAHAHAPNGACCAHVPEGYETKREPTATERTAAEGKLASLAGAPDRVKRLNELQETLAQQLADGTATAAQVIELMKSERDPSVLEVYVAALQQNPNQANAPETIRTFRDLAEASPVPELRRAALQFLGGAWDRDGQVRATVLRLAREETDGAVRHSALACLKEYSVKNQDAATAVNAELIALARGTHADEFRAQAVLSIAPREADEAAAREIAGFLQDRSLDVRMSAADAMGDLRADHRAFAVAQLDAAIAREPDAGVRAAMLLNLVKAGRADAVAALDRIAERDAVLKQDAADYAQILRRGESDLARVMDEKARLESSRIK